MRIGGWLLTGILEACRLSPDEVGADGIFSAGVAIIIGLTPLRVAGSGVLGLRVRAILSDVEGGWGSLWFVLWHRAIALIPLRGSSWRCPRLSGSQIARPRFVSRASRASAGLLGIKRLFLVTRW